MTVATSRPVTLSEPSRGTAEWAIYSAVRDGDAYRTAQALEQATPEVRREMLGALWTEFDGTLHYYALSQAIGMANMDNGNGATNQRVVEHAACADYLRDIGAPCQHTDSEPAAAIAFLDTDWDDRPSAHVVARLMVDSLKAGLFGPNERISENHASIGGLLPLDAAFHLGNVAATRILLEAGADLMAPLKRTGATDIVEYARSFNEPRSDEVAAVVAHALMTLQLNPGAGSRDTMTHVNSSTQPRRRMGL